MKKTISLFTILGFCVLFLSFCSNDDEAILTDPPGNEETPGSNGEEDVDDSGIFVILKLDDVVNVADQAISNGFMKVTEFLEEKKIKAAYGIIGFSLEGNNQAYFDWIKTTAGKGYVEFWNHGYRNRSSEDETAEFEDTYESQVESLTKTISLAKEKLGLDLIAWGPHWSSTNTYTDWALSQFPEIRLAFGYPLEEPFYYKGLIIPRNLNIEHPTHNPSFEGFMQDYNRYKGEVDYFFLQGHPDSWYGNEERWNNFVQIVEFLESEEDIRFVTPGELLDILDRRAKKQ